MLSFVRPAFFARAAPAPARATRAFGSSVVLAKKKAIDPTLPVPPKGPPSAYTLFFKQYVTNPSNSIRTAEGKLDMPALTQKTASAWHELSADEKTKFESEAGAARKLYESAYKAFWESTTAETRAAIEQATGKQVKPPGGKKAYKKSIAERAGNPGKPLTPYFAFAQTVRDAGKIEIPDNLDGTQKVTLLAKETGKLWKELTEAEKQAFKDTYVQAKAKWDEWKVTQKDL